MSRPRVVILGAGPAGVGAAFQLRRLDRAEVTVVEQRPVVGGNAGSFAFGGQRLDYGSHRLHPACDSEILSDIRSFLGDDLLDRPRHGRIHLAEKWIRFPLKPIDVLLRMDRSVALGILRDMSGLSPRTAVRFEEDSYASVLWESIGPTICRHFYFPYARKIWGEEPDGLSGIQARRRVSANTFGKLIRKVLGQVPGLRKPGAGRFYYPRGGYGMISEAYAERATRLGAELVLGWRVVEIRHLSGTADRWKVTAERAGERREWEADYVWSTLPLPVLARIMSPPPDDRLLQACGKISYRAMLLIYLQLPVQRFTEYDAHYFPSPDIAITRLSEPKNYAGSDEPRGSTVLCAELPCAPGDPEWELADTQLASLVSSDLDRAGMTLSVESIGVHVERLRQAYPIYLKGFEAPFALLDEWADGLPSLLTYGRQGLFAHDNTHHALYMAYAAADCLDGGEFDAARWREYRRVFDTHVVED